MKKRLITLMFALVLMICIFSGCGTNVQVFDANYKFEEAVIDWKDGTIERVSVKKWADGDDDWIQITTTDGRVIYTHLSNVLLIHK